MARHRREKQNGTGIKMIKLQFKQQEYWLEKFLSFCHQRKYPNKTNIICPGDSADTLFYVVEGSVAVVLEDDDGNELILTYINAGEYIGETGVFIENEERNVTVRTRSPCVIASISYKHLHNLLEGQLLAEQKDMLLYLGAQVSKRLTHASRKVGRLAFLDIAGQIARTLLDLCKEPDAMTHPDGMQISITRQELGKIVGCTRETAGRMLKALEQEGLISVKGKTIVVFGTR